jgi:hypothetical protein
VRSFIAAALIAAAAFTYSAEVRADDPPLEGADGAAECHALRDKNDTDLKLYEQRQPPTPYKYPQPDLLMGSPWGAIFHGIGESGLSIVAATLLPHIGAQYRGGSPAIVLSWPWTIFNFGPMYACTRKPGSFLVDGHRVHRIMIEPGIDQGRVGTGFSVRPGYRFIWHPTSWVVGPGVGIGSTVEVAGNQEKFRESLSPEIVGHFGNCCAESYFTLAIRYDHFWKGTNNDIIGGTLGYTFF